MGWPTINLLEYEFYHNGKRFLWRQLNGGFQVYGKIGEESLWHICQCDSPEFAETIANALEAEANRQYIESIP